MGSQLDAGSGDHPGNAWAKLPAPALQYLAVKENRIDFWKVHAGLPEEWLFKRFCLRQQLGAAAPQPDGKEVLRIFSAYFETPLVQPNREFSRSTPGGLP